MTEEKVLSLSEIEKLTDDEIQSILSQIPGDVIFDFSSKSVLEFRSESNHDAEPTQLSSIHVEAPIDAEAHADAPIDAETRDEAYVDCDFLKRNVPAQINQSFKNLIQKFCQSHQNENKMTWEELEKIMHSPIPEEDRNFFDENKVYVPGLIKYSQDHGPRLLCIYSCKYLGAYIHDTTTSDLSIYFTLVILMTCFDMLNVKLYQLHEFLPFCKNRDLLKLVLFSEDWEQKIGDVGVRFQALTEVPLEQRENMTIEEMLNHLFLEKRRNPQRFSRKYKMLVSARNCFQFRIELLVRNDPDLEAILDIVVAKQSEKQTTEETEQDLACEITPVNKPTQKVTIDRRELTFVKKKKGEFCWEVASPVEGLMFLVDFMCTSLAIQTAAVIFKNVTTEDGMIVDALMQLGQRALEGKFALSSIYVPISFLCSDLPEIERFVENVPRLDVSGTPEEMARAGFNPICETLAIRDSEWVTLQDLFTFSAPTIFTWTTSVDNSDIIEYMRRWFLGDLPQLRKFIITLSEKPDVSRILEETKNLYISCEPDYHEYIIKTIDGRSLKFSDGCCNRVQLTVLGQR